MSHLERPYLRKYIIKVLVELVEDNDQAANTISEDQISSIVGYIAEGEINPPIIKDYLRCLKNLIKTDIGDNKDMQK